MTPRDEAIDLAEKAVAAASVLQHDLHPSYGTTATWHGGVGGAMITAGCSIIDTPPKHEKAVLAVEHFWRQALQSFDDEARERIGAYREALMRGEDI